MDKIMNFMTNSFAPKVNKVVKNPWISSIQDSIMIALPLRWRSGLHSFSLRRYRNVSVDDYWTICRIRHEFCGEVFFL